MDPTWKTAVWKQFGAAIDMLENTLQACPEGLWSDRSRRPEYWYTVYHTLFFLDLYLSDSVQDFRPPPPFTLDELDPAGVLPERAYSKDELLSYLEHGRRKCRSSIASLGENESRQRCGFDWLDLSRGELLLYNLRHVQHHAAQLHLILRQSIDSAPAWVARTSTGLSSDPSPT